MVQYEVVVEETVIERRTYLVDADQGPHEAAIEVYQRWVNNGEEPGEPAQMGVEERTIEVRAPNGPPIKSYDECEMLELLEQQEEADDE